MLKIRALSARIIPRILKVITKYEYFIPFLNKPNNANKVNRRKIHPGIIINSQNSQGESFFRPLKNTINRIMVRGNDKIIFMMLMGFKYLLFFLSIVFSFTELHMFQVCMLPLQSF